MVAGPGKYEEVPETKAISEAFCFTQLHSDASAKLPPACEVGSPMDLVRSSHAPYPLTPGPETASHSNWLMVSGALPYVTIFGPAPHAPREVRQLISGLLPGQDRIQCATWSI